jgi:hypothetical protein
VEGSSGGILVATGMVLRPGMEAREAAGGASEQKSAQGRGDRKSGGGGLLKGA